MQSVPQDGTTVNVPRPNTTQSNWNTAPLDTLSGGTILGPAPFEEEDERSPSLYGMRSQALAQQGGAMLEATDPATYLLKAGMNPESVSLLEYAGMASPMAIGSLDNIFKKLFKKSVKDASPEELKPFMKQVKPQVKPQSKSILKDEPNIKSYKPKAERQLDSAKAAIMGIDLDEIDFILDKEDLNIPLKPYKPEK